MWGKNEFGKWSASELSTNVGQVTTAGHCVTITHSVSKVTVHTPVITQQLHCSLIFLLFEAGFSNH